jgi:hypothetical protein
MSAFEPLSETKWMRDCGLCRIVRLTPHMMQENRHTVKH